MAKDLSRYAELLKDHRWLFKRMEILERDNHTCQKCGSTPMEEINYDYDIEIPEPVILQVHHTKYVGTFPWETPNRYLITLCDYCHEQAERDKRNRLEHLYLMNGPLRSFFKHIPTTRKIHG